MVSFTAPKQGKVVKAVTRDGKRAIVERVAPGSQWLNYPDPFALRGHVELATRRSHASGRPAATGGTWEITRNI